MPALCPGCSACAEPPSQRRSTKRSYDPPPIERRARCTAACSGPRLATHGLAPLLRRSVIPAFAAAIRAARVGVATAVQAVGITARGQEGALAPLQLVPRHALAAGARGGVVQAVGHGAGLAHARGVQVRVEGPDVVRQAAPALVRVGGALAAQLVGALRMWAWQGGGLVGRRAVKGGRR